MAATRRTQLLMEPAEFRRLQAAARARKTSVAQLIRSAVREKYLAPEPDKAALVEAIVGMRLPAVDWKRARRQIEEARADVR